MRERECDKKGLVDLVAYTGMDGIRMLEIGSYAGESADVFLRTGKVSRITCVDPWTTVIEKDGGNTYRNMDVIEKQFDERLAKYGAAVRKFKGTVNTYVASPGNSMDFDLVYIDGLHTYEGCMNDIRTVIEFIKPKFVSGHDYADFPKHVQGVKKAVNEVFGKPDATFCDTSWIKALASHDIPKNFE